MKHNAEKRKQNHWSHRKMLAMVLCSLFCLLILAGCQNQQEEQPLRPTPGPHTKVLSDVPLQTAVVYFLDGQGKNLVPLTMQMHETREVALVSLQKLLAGAPNDFVQSPLPAGVKVKDLYLEDGVICVDLTEEFLKMEQEQVEKSLACIVATIGAASPKKQVAVFVEGSAVTEIAGEEISQPLSYTAVNPYQTGKTIDSQEKAVVYYSDDQAMYLVPVSYPLPEEDPYTFVMEKLVAGPPKEKGLSSTVWKNTKLNGVTVKDGIATVDFSKEAVAYGGGTAFEYLFVQSILTTFAQFPEVQQVKFLIDGEHYDLLPEGTDLEMPLPVNKTVNYIVGNE